MGRNKRYGAGYSVQNAEEMFNQSVKDAGPGGEGDYRYVALAIGGSPANPPNWAILECVALRQAEERKAARGHPDKVSAVLDDLIRFFDQKQREFEFDQKKKRETEENAQPSRAEATIYQPPSLRSAIIDVLKLDGGANDDDFRVIREAWNWEQDNDPAPSGLFSLDGFTTTSRIERVLFQSAAIAYEGPEDLEYAAWIYKKMVERK